MAQQRFQYSFSFPYEFSYEPASLFAALKCKVRKMFL